MIDPKKFSEQDEPLDNPTLDDIVSSNPTILDPKSCAVVIDNKGAVSFYIPGIGVDEDIVPHNFLLHMMLEADDEEAEQARNLLSNVAVRKFTEWRAAVAKEGDGE